MSFPIKRQPSREYDDTKDMIQIRVKGELLWFDEGYAHRLQRRMSRGQESFENYRSKGRASIT